MSQNGKFRFTVRELTLTATFTAITAILAQIAIPMAPVPFSFGLFGAMLAASILPVKLAVASQLVYVLLGAVGAPVFSSFGGGAQILIGPKGGYIVSYIFMALVMGLLYNRLSRPTFLKGTLISFVGVAVCYLFGAGWLGITQGYSFVETMVAGVLPFIPMDSIKAVVAGAAGVRLRHTLSKARLI